MKGEAGKKRKKKKKLPLEVVRKKARGDAGPAGGLCKYGGPP